jgi:hypothetical protein
MSPAARRLASLRAALGFLQLAPRAPELQLLHRWLDTWTGIGLVVTGMRRQGFQLGLGDHGAGRWIAVFYEGGGGQQPVTAAGVAQEATPWRAVQSAAWATLKKSEEGDG